MLPKGVPWSAGALVAAVLVFAWSTEAAAQTPRACPANFQNTRNQLTCTCSRGAIAADAMVWGTDLYSDDSAICRAARHASAVGPGGGPVTVTPAPGQDGYEGSSRNGVTSRDWKPFHPRSFRVVAATLPPPGAANAPASRPAPAAPAAPSAPAAPPAAALTPRPADPARTPDGRAAAVAQLIALGAHTGSERQPLSPQNAPTAASLVFPGPAATRLVDGDLGNLQALPQLAAVDLTDARGLTARGMATVAQLATLQRLDLTGTQVDDAGIAALAAAPQLATLILSRASAITDAATPHLARMPRLAALNLAGTAVSDEGLRALRDSTTLTALDLDNLAGLSDAGLEHVAAIATLTSLSLRHTAISDAGLQQVARLTRLETLLLGGSRVTDAGMRYLVRLPLATVEINQTWVSDSGLATLAGIRTVTSIAAIGSRVTDAGVRTALRGRPPQELRITK